MVCVGTGNECGVIAVNVIAGVSIALLVRITYENEVKDRGLWPATQLALSN